MVLGTEGFMFNHRQRLRRVGFKEALTSIWGQGANRGLEKSEGEHKKFEITVRSWLSSPGRDKEEEQGLRSRGGCGTPA